MPVNTWINKYITFDIGNSMNWEEPQTRMHILHAAHAQAAGAYILYFSSQGALEAFFKFFFRPVDFPMTTHAIW